MTARPRLDLPARRVPTSGTLTPSEWLAWVQAQVLNATAQSAEQRQLTVAADREPIPLVYGEDRIGAKVLNVVPSGVNVLVQCLWAIAGDSVNDLQYNDEALPGSFSVTHYTGAQVTPDAALVAAFGTHSITYADALTGFMYSVVTMPQAAFSESLNFTARIKGRRLYDPRKDSTVAGGSGAHRLATPATWEWSQNPSLADADYLYSSTYGCGKAVDWLTVITAANANDATVGGQVRRQLDGLTIPGMQPVKSVSETLRTYAGCFHLPGANGVQLVPDRPASSVASYSHTSGQIANLSRLEKRDTGGLPTVMEVVFTDTSAYPWRDDSAVASLPGAGVTIPYRLQQVRLPGIHRYGQAYREAVERLNKLNTTDLSLVLDVFDIGIRHELGDVITVADHPVGLTNKLLRVSDAPQAIERGLWRLPCVEYDPAAYSDDVATGPTYPDTGLASPAMIPPDISSLSVSVLADGTRRFAIIVPTNAARGSRIMVRSVSGASGSWGAMAHFFSIDYDPNVATYSHETNLPAGAGTWSFSAKMVTLFGIESTNAAVINGAALGRDPVTYGVRANLVPISDWTEELGYGSAAYSDARALRGDQLYSAGGGWTVGRNCNNGSAWNTGKGGAWFNRAGTTPASGYYAYLVSSPRIPCTPGIYYEAHIRANPHRAIAQFYLRFYNAAATLFSDAMGGPEVLDAGAGMGTNDPHSIEAMPLLWRFGRAPSLAAGDAFDAAWIELIPLIAGNGQNDPYAFFHQRMLCTHSAPGVTKETYTPWIDGGVPFPRGVGDPIQVNASGVASFYFDVIAGNVLTVFGSAASATVALKAGDTINVEWQFDGTQGTGPVTESVEHATDIVVVGSGKVPFVSSGPGATGSLERSYGAFWTSYNSTDRFYIARLRQYTAPSDQTIEVHVGCGVKNSVSPLGSGTVRLRVYKVRT